MGVCHHGSKSRIERFFFETTYSPSLEFQHQKENRYAPLVQEIFETGSTIYRQMHTFVAAGDPVMKGVDTNLSVGGLSILCSRNLPEQDTVQVEKICNWCRGGGRKEAGGGGGGAEEEEEGDRGVAAAAEAGGGGGAAGAAARAAAGACVRGAEAEPGEWDGDAGADGGAGGAAAASAGGGAAGGGGAGRDKRAGRRAGRAHLHSVFGAEGGVFWRDG